MYKTKFLLFFSFIIVSVKAQIISNEAFIQANFVEVGVNSFGIFGTDNNAPSGFHARVGFSSFNLGFVADPDQDGWSTGNPNYFGDFFYPGAPQEGFSVQFNNSVFHNWNNDPKQIPGTNVSITDLGTKKTALWEGTVNGLNIKQKTEVPTNKVYFVVRLEFKNTTTTTMNNVYYTRTLDPDNEQTISGNFLTKNDVVFSLPNANNNTLVSATGTTILNCYLGLGSRDCRAKPFIIKDGLSPNSSDLIQVIHNRTNTTDYQYSGTLTRDVGIGISFDIGNIAPGETKRLAFTYILKESDLEVALAQTLPEVNFNSQPVLQNSNFNICEGQSVNLSVQNGQEYIWHWEPESYFASPYGETNTLIVPDSNVNLTVTGQSDCLPFTLNFRVTPSTFEAPLVERNDVLCTGSSTSYNPHAGISSPTSSITWYNDLVGGSIIGTSSLFTTPILTNNTSTPLIFNYYYQESTINGCLSQRIPYKVTVYNNLDLPNGELKKCVVGSNTTTFNLTNYIATTFDNPTYTFYNSLNDLTNNIPISNPTSYTNTVNNQVIYVKISVNSTCFDVIELTLRVLEQFVLTPQSIKNCDDDFDKKAIFNLASINSSITSQPGTNFSYFLTNANAQDNVNAIINYTSYTNITNPQVIYVRVFNGNCFEITTLNIEVFNKTIVSSTSIQKCQEKINGSAIFNLTQNNAIISSDPGLLFSYYTTLENLNNNIAITNMNGYENLTSPETIFVKVLNPSNCFSVAQITLNVTPISKFVISDEFKCDNDNDGLVSFDLSLKIPEIAAILPADSYSYKYYNSESNALLDLNSISTNYTNITSPESIFIRAKGLNNCPYIIEFKIIVLVKPKLNLVKTVSLCENSQIILDAGSGFDKYLWSNTETTQSIIVNTEGNYTVTVSNIYGLKTCETSETISVVKSNIAKINNVTINDWTENENSIVIYVSGLGDYEYSLDNINYQNSPNFSNLKSGILNVYVRDKNGCGVSSKEVYVLTYPRYFTPNEDGYNDFWNINLSQYEPDLKVSIFDRFGKLLNTFKGKDKGWNGNYIGQKLPSDDYWFVVNRADGKEFKGHFTLKR